MSNRLDRFLRDLERVQALGEALSGRPRPQPTMREVSPGVFVSTDGDTSQPPSPLRRIRERLRQADRIAGELGRTIRNEIR